MRRKGWTQQAAALVLHAQLTLIATIATIHTQQLAG
jgi:hypothetical protein